MPITLGISGIIALPGNQLFSCMRVFENEVITNETAIAYIDCEHLDYDLDLARTGVRSYCEGRSGREGSTGSTRDAGPRRGRTLSRVRGRTLLRVSVAVQTRTFCH